MHVHRVVLALLTILLLAAPAQSTTLRRYGLSLELPAGWEGRVYENETGLRVIRAGNFPHALTEKGDVVGEETLQWMGSEGIHVTIWDWADWPPPGEESGFAAATLPLQIDRSDFGSFGCGGDIFPAAAIRTVTVDGHLVQVVVSFGNASPGDHLVAEANGVLSTFRIAERL